MLNDMGPQSGESERRKAVERPHPRARRRRTPRPCGRNGIPRVRLGGGKLRASRHRGARAPGTRVVASRERTAVVAAAQGVDVVLHATNAPFPQWSAAALPLTYVAIEAAEAAGATLMFPGNLYHYGAAM